MTDPAKSISQLAKAVERLADVHKESFADIAKGLQAIAFQVKYLGNGNAGTQMGGLEHLGVVLKESAEGLASSIAAIGEELQQRRQDGEN